MLIQLNQVLVGLALREILLQSEDIVGNDNNSSTENKLAFDWFSNNFSADNVETIEFEILENSLMITSN